MSTVPQLRIRACSRVIPGVQSHLKQFGHISRTKHSGLSLGGGYDMLDNRHLFIQFRHVFSLKSERESIVKNMNRDRENKHAPLRPSVSPITISYSLRAIKITKMKGSALQMPQRDQKNVPTAPKGHHDPDAKLFVSKADSTRPGEAPNSTPRLASSKNLVKKRDLTSNKPLPSPQQDKGRGVFEY